MEQERELPVFTIEGTEFIVDVARDELRQKDNPENIIHFDQMAYHKTHYQFYYDLIEKDLNLFFDPVFKIVTVPNLTELDTSGMAQKYGKTEAEIIGKTDYEVMVDQEQLALRERGQLPIIEIAGHPFYVDIRIDLLRPKDDFSTMGISVSDLDYYYDETKGSCIIPYHPKTHSIKDIDFDQVKSIPTDIILVEIPLPYRLDPVAYSRIYHVDQVSTLRNYPLQMNQKACEVPWDETPIKKIIARNLKRELEQKNSKTNKPGRKKGRGI